MVLSSTQLDHARPKAVLIDGKESSVLEAGS